MRFVSRSIGAMLALALTGGLAVAWLNQTTPYPPVTVVHSAPVDRKPVDARARIEPSLSWANEESLAAVDRQTAHLTRFFEEARGRTPQFATSVLGWGSKWRFVADQVPFTRGDRHAEFLKKAFADHLFSDKELTQAIEQVARGFGDTITDVENRMLVRLRQDIAGLPAAELPQFRDLDQLQVAYRTALDRAQTHVGANVSSDVGTLVMSFVVQEVLTQVAVRLGVSAGVLGVGASTSWATFGIGLVVGVIIDQLISWAWDSWADPRGKLALEMNAKLGQIERLIVEGDDELPGLRKKLTEFAQRRAEARRTAILSLFPES